MLSVTPMVNVASHQFARLQSSCVHLCAPLYGLLYPCGTTPYPYAPVSVNTPPTFMCPCTPQYAYVSPVPLSTSLDP